LVEGPLKKLGLRLLSGGRNLLTQQAVLEGLLLAFLLVLMEWLYLVTKPSSLVVFTFWKQVETLVVGCLLVAGPVVVFQFAMAAADSVVVRKHSRHFRLTSLAPALAITSLAFLMADNFSTTMFGLGVHSATGPVRGVLALAVFIAMASAVFRLSARYRAGTRALRWETRGALLCLALSLPAAYSLAVSSAAHRDAESTLPTPLMLPNIIFFAADGIGTENLSIYGGARQTTPHLAAFARSALVFEGAVTNAGKTTGSITALLTGRLATTTKVIMRPHALTGLDSFRHLPGLLRQWGYRTAQESFRYYADGPDLNFQNAFDHANARRMSPHLPDTVSPSAYAGSNPGFVFVSGIGERLSDRPGHLLGLRDMNNPFDDVVVETATTTPTWNKDDARLDRILAFIDEAPAPFFAHVHLMGTHCCRFRPELRQYSDDKDFESHDAFDDTVYNADIQFGRLLDALRARGLLEKTIIVYSSDHPKFWGAAKRVPLVIRFPFRERRGVTATPVELIDVAPTILDYMGTHAPAWMEGTSVLDGRDPDPRRPFFSAVRAPEEPTKIGGRPRSRLLEPGPPSYGISAVAMTVCGNQHTLFANNELETHRIEGYPAACRSALPPAEARRQIIEHLRERGITLLADPPAAP